MCKFLHVAFFYHSLAADLQFIILCVIMKELVSNLCLVWVSGMTERTNPSNGLIPVTCIVLTNLAYSLLRQDLSTGQLPVLNNSLFLHLAISFSLNWLCFQ